MKKENIIFIEIIIIIALLLVPAFYIIIKNGIEENRFNEAMQKDIEEVNSKIEEENKKIEELKNSYTNKNKTLEPYIPNGFKYIEGDVNSGYIISDENENQYVWVPCESLEDIKKTDFSEEPFITYKECYDEEYEKFVISVIENRRILYF